MDTTFFLAQFYGWLSLLVAIVYLIRGKRFLNTLLNMHKDKKFVFLSGWFLFSIGLATVLLHNLWVLDWRIIITLAGWASLLKGITRITFPEITNKLVFAFFENRLWYFRVSMITVGLLGAYLLYKSFI